MVFSLETGPQECWSRPARPEGDPEPPVEHDQVVTKQHKSPKPESVLPPCWEIFENRTAFPPLLNGPSHLLPERGRLSPVNPS